MNDVERAKVFAYIKHKGQKDDDGKDYFENHLEPVVAILRLITVDENVLSAGYLHDTIEDTDTSSVQLYAEFDPKIVDLVMELTHEGKKDEHGYYFPRLHSKEAIIIKFADRLSNISRMSSWSEKRQEQYLKKSKFWKDKI